MNQSDYTSLSPFNFWTPGYELWIFTWHCLRRCSWWATARTRPAATTGWWRTRGAAPGATWATSRWRATATTTAASPPPPPTRWSNPPASHRLRPPGPGGLSASLYNRDSIFSVRWTADMFLAERLSASKVADRFCIVPLTHLPNLYGGVLV